MTYYSKIEIEEHLLYVDELHQHYKLYSTKDKPHHLFMREFLKEWARQNIDNYIQLYYINRYGSAKEVYPRALYLPAFNYLYSVMKKENETYELLINNKKFLVKRLEE